MARGVAGHTLVVDVKVGGGCGAGADKVDGVSNEAGIASDTSQGVGVPESGRVAGNTETVGINEWGRGGADTLLLDLVVDGGSGAGEAGKLVLAPVVGGVASNAPSVGINKWGGLGADAREGGFIENVRVGAASEA